MNNSNDSINPNNISTSSNNYITPNNCNNSDDPLFVLILIVLIVP